MIHGIGTDIVEFARIEKMFARYGRRLAERMLSESELTEFQAHANQARFLAKRFAAKEAFAKAAGTGLRAPMTLHNIAVLRDALGKPHIECAHELAVWLAARGINAHHVSLSDEGDLVLAYVILERI